MPSPSCCFLDIKSLNQNSGRTSLSSFYFILFFNQNELKFLKNALKHIIVFAYSFLKRTL